MTEKRTRTKLPGPGPYLAEVTSLVDKTFMGNLEVALIKGVPSNVKLKGETFVVRYMSPFYGVTSLRFQGTNARDFNDVQKSYGMWMVPPDIGNTVMVIFIGGEPNQGYWIGCVPEIYNNHMIPGIAASLDTDITAEQRRRYKTDYLPVAEFLKDGSEKSRPGRARPVHPFAERLVQQGLLTDFVRGVTNSSARREAPSSVFGISTPGPIDPDGRKGEVGYDTTEGEIPRKKPLPISRLGGSTFVMDDGDIDGQNELVRIRTRTGHQILMHNSHDLIYIANSKGTAWIELTSNGKIDIYAEDSVSIHSKADFNFLADRDINLEAGGNVRIKAGINMDTNVGRDCNLIVGNDNKIDIGGIKHEKIEANFNLTVNDNFNLLVKKNTKQTSGTGFDIKVSGGQIKIGSSGTLNLKSDTDITATAVKINLNGPTAASPSAAEEATSPSPLEVFYLPNRLSESGWENDFYRAEDIQTIMKRAPTHEPWDQHENINPQRFSSGSTNTSPPDASTFKNTRSLSFGLKPNGSASVDYNKQPNIQGVPPMPTGNTEEDNITAFLWMIRVLEGGAGPNGYRAQFPSRYFSIDDPSLPSYQYKDHPKQRTYFRNTIGEQKSSDAAGAYQFLSSTWNDCKKALNLPDFSPASQDKAAVLLLQQKGALDDIKKGNFTAAIQKTNRTWASLPGSPDHQNPKPYETALALYKKAGGTVVT